MTSLARRRHPGVWHSIFQNRRAPGRTA
jgi:hypothetical protein